MVMWVYVTCSGHLITFILLTDIASASSCNKIIEQNGNLQKRYLSVEGVIRNISLYWGSEPGFVASTLLAVILRHKMGYQNVGLVKGSDDLERLAQQAPYEKKQKYNEAILAVSVAWDSSPAKPMKNVGIGSGLAVPRLYEFGASSVPVQQRLYARLADKYRHQEQCKNVTHLEFYADKYALKNCGFLISSDHDKKVVVFGSISDHTLRVLRKLEERAQFPLQYIMLKSAELIQRIQSSNQSFLFVDYEIWSGYPNVSVVQLPPCIPTGYSPCSQELDTAVAMRIGEVYIFQQYTPQLYQAVYNFLPTVETLRTILQLHSQGIILEEAACEWVLEHNDTVASWLGNYETNQQRYEIAVFYCSDDPDYNNYYKILETLHEEIPRLYHPMLTVGIRLYKVICNNVNSVSEQLDFYKSTGSSQMLIGAVVGGITNVTDVIKTVNGLGVPVLFCDAPRIDTDKTMSTWLTSGSTIHLAVALHHFIRKWNWSRVGVLSEPTATAKRFIVDLKTVNSDIGFGEHTVKLNLRESDAEIILNQLRDEKANIILVNTNYNDAATILSTAAKLKMNASGEFAWIVREWKPYNHTTTDIEHLLFSFSPVCGRDVLNTSGLPDLRNKISESLENCTSEDTFAKSWPMQGTGLVDAVLTLVHGFNYSIHKNPQIRNDVHSAEAIKLFETSLVTTPVQGLNQILTYKGHSLEETLVYVYKWRGSKHIRLSRWRVNATKCIVTKEEQNWRSAYLLEAEVPQDGALQCTLKFGDSYSPSCYDTYLWIGMILFVLAVLALILAYFFVCRHLKKQQMKFIYELVAQRKQRAAALSAGYLTDRSVVTLREELGAGRFGFVRLAELRISGRAPKYVAVKALRDCDDESEILHEACILASLDHDNIIRLVGVCIDNEPPLVLMEIAFFGDLLGYLQRRRYLAEGTSDLLSLDEVNEEATHVSAESLTRLARQAASALGYLSLRGIIHRDLRASNCLVDAKRSLKLGDFGLAREAMTTGLDSGGNEYKCIRRGLLPVLWMAPESLEQGVFSTASDVWAFGLLIFEIVTLGARPFGEMSPLRVMQFVAKGGKPPLPRDASPQTIGIARMCWQREPEQRPSAAEVVAYLAERPFALTPALDCDYDEPVIVDSGYGALHMTKL